MAAKTEDAAMLLAASRINAAAQSARTYVLAACRGVMSPDQKLICAAAMDWIIFDSSHGNDEWEVAKQRLKPAAQIFAIDLDKAFDAVADAISSYGQFLYFEYKCLVR